MDVKTIMSLVVSKGAKNKVIQYDGLDIKVYTLMLYAAKRFGAKCYCCGKEVKEVSLKKNNGKNYYNVILRIDDKTILTADHVKPLSKGGPNSPGNIRPMCNICNQNKADTWNQ